MPPLVLEITVRDDGTPVLKRFSSAVEDVGQKTNQQMVPAFQSAGQHAERLTNSLSSTVKTVGLAVAAFAGFQGIKATWDSVTSSVISFDKELANTNTVLIGSKVSIEQLKQQILALPPSLGTATELTKGLYQALSAGIEPGKAVAFVGEQAKLASAGLTDLSTTVKVSTAAMDAFGIQASDASHISDVLFTIVARGKTEFDPLAHSIANVFPLAKSLGVSFEETAATFTTLLRIFPNAAEATTGFRAILSGLTGQMDNFKAAGIDVKAVIAEEGLTGLLRRLAEVTGLSADVLKAKFIPDVEGTTAALGLMGPQFKTQTENVKAFGDTAGTTATAFAKQQESISAAVDRIKNSFDRLIQGGGLEPLFKAMLAPIEAWLTQLNKGGTASVEFASIASTAFGAVVTALGTIAQASIAVIEGWNRIKQGIATLATLWFDALEAMTKAARNLGLISAETAEASLLSFAKASLGLRQMAIDAGQSADEWGKVREKIAEGQKAIEESLGKAGEQAKAFASTMGTAGQTTVKAAEDIKGAFVSLEDTLKKGPLSAEEVRKWAGVWDEAMQKAAKAIAPVGEEAKKQGIGVEEAFTKLGLSTQATLQNLAKEALDRFQVLLTSGKATPQELLEEWQKTVEKINAGAFKQLPENFRDVNQQMQQIATKAGVELPKPLTDAFGNIQLKMDEVPKTGEKMSAALKQQIQTIADAEKLWADEQQKNLAELGESTRAEADRLKDLAVGFRDYQSGITKLNEGLSLNISRVKDLSFEITGMAAKYGLLAANTSVVFERLGTDIVTLTRQSSELTQALLHLSQDATRYDSWINVAHAARAYLGILGEIAGALLRIKAQGQETTDYLQAAYDVLGSKSSHALKQVADAAVEAFEIASRSGTSTAEHLADIWTKEVVPKLIEAYGSIPPQFTRLNDQFGQSIQQVATATQALTSATQSLTNAQASNAQATQQATVAYTQMSTAIGNVALQQQILNGTIAQQAPATGAAIPGGGSFVPPQYTGNPASGAPPGYMPNPSGAGYVPINTPPPGYMQNPSGYGYVPIGSYQLGTPYVPSDMLAYLHKGEAVVPARQNMPRSTAGQDTAGPIHVTVAGITVQVQAEGGNINPRQLGRDVETGIAQAIREGRWTVELRRALGL